MAVDVPYFTTTGTLIAFALSRVACFISDASTSLPPLLIFMLTLLTHALIDTTRGMITIRYNRACNGKIHRCCVDIISTSMRMG
jgi:hypothetical protein